MRRGLVGIVVCAALVLGAGGAASAGERTGSGKDTKWGPGGQTPVSVTAKSECAFSGLEDHDFLSDVVPGEVQNWGAIVSDAGGHLGGAGPIGCNAALFPAK